jgi:hypothetical protein
MGTCEKEKTKKRGGEASSEAMLTRVPGCPSVPHKLVRSGKSSGLDSAYIATWIAISIVEELSRKQQFGVKNCENGHLSPC